MNIYKQGILHLLGYPREKLIALKLLYEKEEVKEMHKDRDDQLNNNFWPLTYYHDECNEMINKQDKPTNIADCIVKYARFIEDNLKFDDMLEIFGPENIYIYATIDGFKKNSEYDSRRIESNSFGKISSSIEQTWNGPVEAIMQKIGINNGEFEGSWLREVQ